MELGSVPSCHVREIEQGAGVNALVSLALHPSLCPSQALPGCELLILASLPYHSQAGAQGRMVLLVEAEAVCGKRAKHQARSDFRRKSSEDRVQTPASVM